MSVNRPVGVTDADGPATHGVFISYRRDDTSGHVIALMEPLSARFGAERIFKDTDSIPAGIDFVEEVQRQLASCAVMLVVIGREWLTVSHPRHPGRRLDDPKDLVRLEVSTALATPRVLVIPVLVDRASMPSAEDLPPDLQPLARRNYIELSDTRWKGDTEHLIRRIQESIAVPASRSLRKTLSAYSVHLLVVAVLALTLLLVVSSDWRPFVSPAADKPSQGSSPSPPITVNNPEKRASVTPVSDNPVGSTGNGSGADAAPPPAVDPAPPPAAAPPAGSSSTPKPRTTARANPPPAATGPRLGETTASHTPPNTGAGRQSETPTTNPPPPPKVDRQNEAADGAAIREVLERFRQAYNRKDQQAVSEVYPEVRADRMIRDMKDCAQLNLVFGEPQVRFLSVTEAQVRVPATYGCRPTTAQRWMVPSPDTDTYMFARRGGSWVIESRLVSVDVTR